MDAFVECNEIYSYGFPISTTRESSKSEKLVFERSGRLSLVSRVEATGIILRF